MRLTLIVENSGNFGVYVERGSGLRTPVKDIFTRVLIRKLAKDNPPAPLLIETTEEFLARGGEVTQCRSRGELYRQELSARREAAAQITLKELGLDELTI